MVYFIGVGTVCPEGNFSKFLRYWIEFMLAFAENRSNSFIMHLNHAMVQDVNIHVGITVIVQIQLIVMLTFVYLLAL